MSSYRGRVPRIRWGSTLQDEIVFGLPLERPKSFGQPREGREEAQAPSGVEDAWTLGTDRMLLGAVRMIPTEDRLPYPRSTGWLGSAGWDAFLEYARDKGGFRVYPDSRNLLDSPRLTTDTNADGVANDWPSAAAANATTAFSVGAGGQTISVTANSSATPRASLVKQRIAAVLPGETLALTALLSGTVTAGAFQASLSIDWYTSAGALISSSSALWAPGAATRRGLAAVAPANTAYAYAVLSVWLSGSADLGNATFTDVRVSRGGTAADAFVDASFYHNAYLVAPMSGPPDDEAHPEFRRISQLTVRDADGLRFSL